MTSPIRSRFAAFPRLARILVAVYLLVVLTQMLPLGLTETAWWLRWIGVATSNGVIPLLAGVLVWLAVAVRASERRRYLRWRRLAMLAFVLLIPLQISAAVVQDDQVSRAERQRIGLLQQRFDLVSAAAASAGSPEALQELAARLSGDTTAQLRLAPDLEAARRQVSDQVAVGRARAMAAMDRAVAARRLRAGLDTVRVVGLALLFALAFAALR